MEIAIKKYENYPSIIAVTEKSNFIVHFEFEEVNLKDIEKEVLNLITKKAVESNSISAKVLKETSYICSPVLHVFGVMTIFVFKGLVRNPEIRNTSV